MAKKIGLVKVHSEDLSYYEIQTSLSENNSDVQFSVYDNEAKLKKKHPSWESPDQTV